MSKRQRKDTVFSCRQDVPGPKDISDIWRKIVKRCLDPRHHLYHRYGGRGIKICDRWRNSFKAFWDDLPPRPSKNHTLHRIDNDKGYEPGNVIWLTRKEHSMLHHNGQYVIVDGIRDSVAATAKRTGVSAETFARWMRRCFSPQEIADQWRTVTRRHGPGNIFPFLELGDHLSDSAFHAMVKAFLDDLVEGTDVHVKAAKAEELRQREAAYQNKYRERKRLGLV